ncbi:MAG: thioredoxin [Candidatus Parvarchaeota archaeon]|jgi:thioredoxin 1|nr:thioredoxin [Candidatus Parvarchaeota archaeon]MCL5017995.1 thioredoxin [Candidatus Parvarchaeota archaeon]
MAVHLTKENFLEELKKADVSIVDFWAEWCHPCKMLSPILDDLEKKIGHKMKFFKLNVDNQPAIATAYGIQSIPTLLIFKGGKPIASFIGLIPMRELENKLMAFVN